MWLSQLLYEWCSSSLYEKNVHTNMFRVQTAQCNISFKSLIILVITCFQVLKGSLNLLYSFYHFLYSSWLFHLNRNCWLKLDFSKPERPIILSQYIHVMSFVIGSMFSSLDCCICSNFSCFTSILVKININDKNLDLDGVYTCWICLLMYFCR